MKMGFGKKEVVEKRDGARRRLLGPGGYEYRPFLFLQNLKKKLNEVVWLLGLYWALNSYTQTFTWEAEKPSLKGLKKPNRKKEPKKGAQQAWITSYEFHIKC